LKNKGPTSQNQNMYAPRIAPTGRPRATKRTKYAPKRKRVMGIPVQVRVGRQAIPKQLMNTLTYCENINRSVVSGISANYQFSCNGLFDPNITGTGRQPMYFDQLSALYNHYTVLRSRISVTWSVINTLANGGSPINCTLYVDDDTDSGTSNAADSAAERPSAKTGVFVPAAQGTKTLWSSWDAAQTFGPSPQGNSQLIGTSASNPTEQSYFTIVSFFPAGDTITMALRVKIDYDVVWDEPTTVAPS